MWLEIEEPTEHLDRTFSQFLELFPTDVQKKLKEVAYFAGGCIYSLVNSLPVKDYDIFLIDTSEIETIKNAIFWHCETEYALSYGKYQIVTKFYGPPDECVGQFDFLHNMYYYIPYSGEISSACGTFLPLHSKQLEFNEERARDIEGVYLRIEKFEKRGFQITEEEKEKIAKRTTKKAIKEHKEKIKKLPRRTRIYA